MTNVRIDFRHNGLVSTQSVTLVPGGQQRVHFTDPTGMVVAELTISEGYAPTPVPTASDYHLSRIADNVSIMAGNMGQLVAAMREEVAFYRAKAELAEQALHEIAS